MLSPVRYFHLIVPEAGLQDLECSRKGENATDQIGIRTRARWISSQVLYLVICDRNPTDHHIPPSLNVFKHRRYQRRIFIPWQVFFTCQVLGLVFGTKCNRRGGGTTDRTGIWTRAPVTNRTLLHWSAPFVTEVHIPASMVNGPGFYPAVRCYYPFHI